MNFSNVSLSHRLTGPAWMLLWRLFLVTGTTANLLLCGVLSMSCTSCKEFKRRPFMSHSFFQGLFTCADVGLSTGSRWLFAPRWISMGCKEKPVTAPSLQAVGESLFVCLDCLLPLFLHRPWGLQSCLSYIFSLLYPSFWCAVIFPFLKYATTEVFPLFLMGSALPNGGSVLEPAGSHSDIMAAPDVSSHRLLTQSPATKTLPHRSNLFFQFVLPYIIRL